MQEFFLGRILLPDFTKNNLFKKKMYFVGIEWFPLIRETII